MVNQVVYKITDKKGSKNMVAGALSRLNEDTSKLNQISIIIPLWQQEVIKSYEEVAQAQEIITQLSIDSQAIPHYQLFNGLLKFQ